MSWQFPLPFEQPGAPWLGKLLTPGKLQLALMEASIVGTLHYDSPGLESSQWTEYSPAPRVFEVDARQPAGSSQMESVRTCIAVHHRYFQLKPSTFISSLRFRAHLPFCFKVDYVVPGSVDLSDACAFGRWSPHHSFTAATSCAPFPCCSLLL